MPQKKLLLAISLGLFLGFIIFSYFVAKEQFTKLDFDSMVKIQDRLPRSVDLPFSTLSVLGSAEITGIFWLGLVIFVSIKKWFKVAAALFLLPLALVIEVFGKLFVYHPGPPHLLYRGIIQFDFPSHFVQADYSYPSGHVTRTAFLIIFLMFLLFFRKSFKFQIIPQIILIALLVLMVVSRVYLGEHWTSDVIGGLLIGASFGLMAALTIPIRHSKDSGELSRKQHPSR